MVQVYSVGRGVGRCLQVHREHVCQRRPPLRWQVHRVVGRSLLGVSHLQLERLLVQRRDLLGGVVRTLGVVALGGLGAAGRVAAAPQPESLVAARSDHAMTAAAGLLAGSALIRGALAAGQLSIRSAYFEIGNGLVTLL